MLQHVEFDPVLELTWRNALPRRALQPRQRGLPVAQVGIDTRAEHQDVRIRNVGRQTVERRDGVRPVAGLGVEGGDADARVDVPRD